MHVVGLTGGIGTGKSTVASILRDQGVAVIDADHVAREVVASGEPALAAIVAALGADVLDADGGLDRGAMRKRIASDPDARATLEGITHPAIRSAIAEEIVRLAAAGEQVVVVEAALLVETGSYRMYPTLIVVSCDPDTQLARVRARDGQDATSARALIAAQLPMADKEAVATHVIENNGSLQDLSARTLEVWAAVSR